MTQEDIDNGFKLEQDEVDKYSLCESDSILIDKNGDIIEWLVYACETVVLVLNGDEELHINKGERLVMMKDLTDVQRRLLLESLIAQGIRTDEENRVLFGS